MSPCRSTSTPLGRLNSPSPQPDVPKGHQELAVGAELLDAVVAPVGHVDIAQLIDGDAPRHVKLALAAAVAAPLAQEAALAGELLDAVVERIDDVEIALGVEVHAGRAVELPGAAALLAPAVEQFALLVDDGDAVQRLIREVEILVAVGEDRDRPGHLPRLAAVAAEVAEVLIFCAVPANQRVALAATEDIEAILLAERQVDRPVGQPPHSQRLVEGKSGAQESVWSAHGGTPCEFLVSSF